MVWRPSIPADNVDVEKSEFRENWAEINKFITLARSYGGKGGELLAVLDNDSGPDVVSAVSAAIALSFAGRQIGFYMPQTVEISASLSLSTNAHSGRLIYCVNASAATITLNKNADPAAGVTHGFACTIMNASAAAVSVSSTNLTRTGTTHTRITFGQAANIYVDGNRNWFFFTGGTEP